MPPLCLPQLLKLIRKNKTKMYAKQLGNVYNYK
jgi:hypothetical protein